MVSRKPQLVKAKGKKKVKGGGAEIKSAEVKNATEEENSAGLETLPQPKEKLQRVRKNKKRSQSRRGKGKKGGMKLKTLNLALKDAAEGKNVIADPTKKCSLKELNSSLSFGITLGGIPKNWKGNLEEITDKYKEFNVLTCGIRRQNFEKEICQVIYMYFNTEEDMKNAVLNGQRDFCGKTLIVRTNPVRTVYVTGIPLDATDETVRSDLKDAFGASVYDITIPREDDKLLGYAVLYVVDQRNQEEILTRTLNLWEKVQYCCSEDDFFKKFVLNILSGWEDKCPEVMKDLMEFVHKKDIEVGVDSFNKRMIFSDESSILTILKKSGMTIRGKKMIFSRSPKISFVMRNISKSVTKDNVLNYLYGVQAFNIKFHKRRCKASFDAPVEEMKKCSDFHQKEFFGRKLQVLKSDSEELKLAKKNSKKKFQELLAKNEECRKPGDKLHALAEMYLKIKKRKSDKNKSPAKKDESKPKTKRKRFRNRTKSNTLPRIIKVLNKCK